ncbi:MAG: 6-bladed beta-propeller [Betaproteobacteria bacterium]
MGQARQKGWRRGSRAASLALAALGLWLASAAGAAPATKPALYWPAPPPNARIAYVRQFRSERDFPRSKRTLWEKLKRLLVGYQEEWALRSPYGLGVYRDRLYITDTQAQTVWVADFAGQTFSPFVRSTSKLPLPSPIGVAVEEDGRVFVSDSVRNAVYVFSPAGKLLSVLGEKKFGRPTGLAVDRPRHRLYVVDTVRNEVVVFSTSTLKEIRRFGRLGTQPGEFNLPVQVAVRSGIVYIVDTMNFRVQVFNADGEFVGLFGQMGDGPGDLPRPKGIGVDSEGNIYVADALFDNVQIFERLGRLLMSFGGLGEKEGRFWLPAGLAIDERDRIYVADSANRRIQVFQFLGRAGERQ